MAGSDSDPDRAQLAAAYREYAPTIFRYLLAKTRSRERAEDLTQEVFLAAAAARPRESDGRPLLPWLYAVAERRYVDELRRRSAEVTCCPIDEAECVAQPDPDVDATMLHALVAAIRGLPPAQSRVCVMRLFEGRSFAEICCELETSERACRMRFHRALRALQEALMQGALAVLFFLT